MLGVPLLVLTRESVSNIKAAHEHQTSQNLLSEPVDALLSLGCLANTSIFLRGYSELRQMASWLHEALQCQGPGLSHQQTVDPVHGLNKCHPLLRPHDAQSSGGGVCIYC